MTWRIQKPYFLTSNPNPEERFSTLSKQDEENHILEVGKSESQTFLQVEVREFEIKFLKHPKGASVLVFLWGALWVDVSGTFFQIKLGRKILNPAHH